MRYEIQEWASSYFDSLWDDFMDTDKLDEYVDDLTINQMKDDDTNRHIFLETFYPDEWEEFCIKEFHHHIDVIDTMYNTNYRV